MDTLKRSGLWIGLTVCFLLASLGMVQIRCRVTGGYACGDWPKQAYTWQFWPAFAVALLVWLLGARVWSRRQGRPLMDGLDAQGGAASPLLGLVLVWTWYGLTTPRIHPPACTIAVLCHDTVPLTLFWWSLPWVLCAAWSLASIWRPRPVETSVPSEVAAPTGVRGDANQRAVHTPATMVQPRPAARRRPWRPAERGGV